MSTTAKPLAFQGTLCHTPELGSVQVLQDQLLIVDGHGAITYIGQPSSSEAAAALQAVGLQQADVRVLDKQQLLLPGFIDTHCHAPQYTFTGVGTDLPLFDWLHTYTFPCEAAFADDHHAELIYKRLVQRLLQLGTTTANYFTTLHVGACKVLVDVVVEAGQRCVVGKCCMDQHAPEFYIEQGVATSLQGAKEVVAYIKSKGCSRVMPSVIPRFIPTCSQELLEGLGQLAAEFGLHVHSHISESRDQVDFSKQLHPGSDHDAAIYNAAGLLRPRAIYAHGTQLTTPALQLMAAKGAAISHCPLSNFYFGDGLLCVARALAHGVKVGLGTDVAGGFSPSMLQAMRMAVINSHALKAAALMADQQQKQEASREGGEVDRPSPLEEYGQQLEKQQQHHSSTPHGVSAGLAGSRVAAAISSPAVSAAAQQHQLSWEDALYLATAGGADALGLDSTVGHFAVGMEFDALLVDCGLSEVFDVLQDERQPLVLLEHFINNGDDRNIRAIWVKGVQVSQKRY